MPQGMTTPESTNGRSPSTTWAWRHVKIAPAPQANSTSSASESSLFSLLPWPRRKPLSVTLIYRGGPQAWFEVRTRGRVIRRPGDTALVDLMSEVMRQSL